MKLAHTEIDRVLPTDDPLLHVALATLHTIPGDKDDRFFSATEIDEVYPQDGSLYRRIVVDTQQMPVCATAGGYTFLTTREEDGRLQLTHATPVP